MDSLKDTAAHVKNMEFKIFQWPKSLMPPPFWTPERKRFYIDQYGGEDAPAYKHNVLGEDGDPENTVFPWEQLKYCIKDVPEYRCLKILVNESHNEVIITGYRIEYSGESGPAGQVRYLIDETCRKSTFFDFDGAGESEFRRLIKSFFISAPGFKRGGGDLGFSGDETEIDIAGVCDGACRKMNKRFEADQEELSQGGAEAACRAHTPDVAGSIPAPATKKHRRGKA